MSVTNLFVARNNKPFDNAYVGAETTSASSHRHSDGFLLGNFENASQSHEAIRPPAENVSATINSNSINMIEDPSSSTVKRRQDESKRL